MLILASASPRRKQLLAQIGVPVEVCSADIDEAVREAENAEEYVLRMATEKAQAVAARYPQRTVLAADTIVLHQQQILTKPQNAAQAQAMLQQLSGSSHQVLTAVVIMQGARTQAVLERTWVHFAKLSAQQIAAYVATQEPLDKAGSYGIQGRGAVLVQSIEGCYSNVVGLPLAKTAELLEAFNIPIWQ